MTVDWYGKKVAVIGAARQGLALARYLLTHGAEVVINDHQPAEALAAARQSLVDLPGRLTWITGGHPFQLLDGIDLVCISGGVPLSLPLVQEALRRGIPLSNDSQIFLEMAPCLVIGITGSAGKTTTTTLVGRMIAAGDYITSGSFTGERFDEKAGDGPVRSASPGRVWVGGNIGSPLIASVDEMKPGDLTVMELSSFQLEIMDRSPRICAVLNVTPNHLDRHKTMEAYTGAKARILQNQRQGDVAVLGRDDPGAWSLASRVQGHLLSFGFSDLSADGAGVYRFGDGVYLRAEPGAKDRLIVSVSEIALRGAHNLLNVMAACAIVFAAGLPLESMRKGVVGFSGVAHRLEFVRRWHGADWFNDSIATAPERAAAAIRSFDEPLVLLVGGRDKDLPWDEWASLTIRRVDHLVVFGEAAGVILQTLERISGKRVQLTSPEDAGTPVKSEANGLQTVTLCKDLRQGSKRCRRISSAKADVVLLSPGGTSFDEFHDFEERGLCFAQWVKELV